MSIRIMDIGDLPRTASGTHLVVTPPTDAERARRDIREFVESGASCAEVIGVVPEDASRGDIDRAGHLYRHHCSLVTDAVRAVQRAGRVFLVRKGA